MYYEDKHFLKDCLDNWIQIKFKHCNWSNTIKTILTNLANFPKGKVCQKCTNCLSSDYAGL